MTRASCPGCRLRFTGASTANLAECPECGDPLDRDLHGGDLVGYRLHVLRDPLPALPFAVEVALPLPVVD